MKTVTLLGLRLSFLLIMLAVRACAVEYQVTDLGALGGEWSEAWAINDHGQVVGEVDYDGTDSHAFFWADGVMTDLGTLGGNSRSAAIDLNNFGQVVGYSGPSACLWEDGPAIGTLGGMTSTSGGVNDFGQVVGYAWLAGNDEGHAFLWENGTMTDLGVLPGYEGHSSARDINESGQIVGTSQADSTESHPFLWDGGVMTDLGSLGGPEAGAYGINGLGQVVGGSDLADGSTGHPYLWTGGTMQDLGTLAGYQRSVAHSINSSGRVVGYAMQSNPLYS